MEGMLAVPWWMKNMVDETEEEQMRYLQRINAVLGEKDARKVLEFLSSLSGSREIVAKWGKVFDTWIVSMSLILVTHGGVFSCMCTKHNFSIEGAKLRLENS